MAKFPWKGYLDVATVLAESDDEASLRCAISRAYYAAFHAARDYICETDREGELSRHGGEHETVWKLIGRHGRGNRVESRIAEAGQSLKGWRNWADYRTDSRTRLRENAGMLMAKASMLLRLVSELPK